MTNRASPRIRADGMPAWLRLTPGAKCNEAAKAPCKRPCGECGGHHHFGEGGLAFREAAVEVARVDNGPLHEAAQQSVDVWHECYHCNAWVDASAVELAMYMWAEAEGDEHHEVAPTVETIVEILGATDPDAIWLLKRLRDEIVGEQPAEDPDDLCGCGSAPGDPHHPGCPDREKEYFVGAKPRGERPTEAAARRRVQSFLREEGHPKLVDEFSITEDGDDAWAFWIDEGDTTSYVHHDLRIEWLGTGRECEACGGDEFLQPCQKCGRGFPPEASRSCRKCGCTDEDCRRCIEKTGQPCFWVERDLCSACANDRKAWVEDGAKLLVGLAEYVGLQGRNEAGVFLQGDMLSMLDGVVPLHTADRLAEKLEAIDPADEAATTAANAANALRAEGAQIVIDMLRGAFMGSDRPVADNSPRDRKLETEHRTWRLIEAALDGEDPKGSLERMIKVKAAIEGMIEVQEMCGGREPEASKARDAALQIGDTAAASIKALGLAAEPMRWAIGLVQGRLTKLLLAEVKD